MADLDYQHGSFIVPFEDGYISIHPEMAPKTKGISPTGRYFIYCLHYVKGSCTFIVEQNEYCNWIANTHPPFIDQDLIDWIGKKIESLSK